MAHNIQLGAADMNHSIKLRYGCQDLHFETGGDDDDSYEDGDEGPGDADALHDDDDDDNGGNIGVVVTSNNSVVCMCPTVS